MYKINDRVIFDNEEWFIESTNGNEQTPVYYIQTTGVLFTRRIVHHREIKPVGFKHVFNELANEV